MEPRLFQFIRRFQSFQLTFSINFHRLAESAIQIDTRRSKIGTFHGNSWNNSVERFQLSDSEAENNLFFNGSADSRAWSYGLFDCSIPAAATAIDRSLPIRPIFLKKSFLLCRCNKEMICFENLIECNQRLTFSAVLSPNCRLRETKLPPSYWNAKDR